ncbi:MAG: hypothetical protein LM586_02250, partial [Desulfurococcales archaeon]|nr:hypothetical protein [Desulfurococcales archaeon]
IGVELVKDSSKTPAREEAKKIMRKMFDEGVLVGIGGVYGNVIRIQPPLVIEYEKLDKILEAFERSIRNL